MKIPFLTLDIETIATNRDDVREYIASKVTHPATMSKPETIAKWVAESKAEAVEEAVAKTALDGSFGRVCVIGWAVGDEPPMVIYNVDLHEREILERFARAMTSVPQTSCIVGHFVTGFDLRFLWQRYVINGIKPPKIIQTAVQAKPWETSVVFDTMIQWSGAGAKPGGSLEKLCLALGIPSPKGDITGATVGAAVEAGRIAEVASYCEKDVVATRAIYKRMTFQEAVCE